MEKTKAAQAFDQLVKDTFQATLKPLSFKKKGNSFYLATGSIGKLINIQKSQGNDKDSQRFTLNVSVFSADYWNRYYNFQSKPIPDIPSEPECVVRRRIGSLLGQPDTWYEIAGSTDMAEMSRIQLHNLNEVILPYFHTVQTIDDVVEQLKRPMGQLYYVRLQLLCLLQRKEEALEEMNHQLAEATSPSSRNFIYDIANEYGLV